MMKKLRKQNDVTVYGMSVGQNNAIMPVLKIT